MFGGYSGRYNFYEDDGIEPTSPEAPAELCFCQRRWNEKNLPSRYLPDEDRLRYLEEGVPLHQAILNGDSIKVKRILRENPNTLLHSGITEGYETALHVAVGAGQPTIVKVLVDQMESEELERQDSIGNTSFCTGAATGNVEIADILMKKNSLLPLLRGACNKTPLNIAAAYGYPEMIRFIYENFTDHIPHLKKAELEEIFFACIYTGLFDLAIALLQDPRNLVWARNREGETALGTLAGMHSAFDGKNSSRIPKWPINLFPGCGSGSGTISPRKKAIDLTKLLYQRMLLDKEEPLNNVVDEASKALCKAARLGNYNFVAVLIGCYPNLILRGDENQGSIFHIAVVHRQANIFRQIHTMGILKDIIATYEVLSEDKKNRYNLLHLAAKLPSSDRLNTVSGAALQMQRELQWFKEVENVMHPSEREKIEQVSKLTPRQLFTKEHSELRKAGEEWMKNTAESCMIVATLVTAVVFTITSSLPGGHDQNTGIPMNINKTMFHVFAVAGAVALYSSIVSTLLFLSIFTSRYAEDDFLLSLPLRLAAGITTLLLSSLAMMVDFAAIFFLAYHGKHERVRWVPILASAMSIFPVVVVFVFQYQVVRDLCLSTIGYRHLFRTSSKSKCWEVHN